MSEIVIRPTMKFVYMGYALTALVAVALGVALTRVRWTPDVPPSVPHWVPLLPALLLLWPLKRHLRNRTIKTTILDSQLKHESGLLNKTTRTIMLPRVQDVTVHQRLGQRIFAVGDVSIETAGEASRLTLFQIDHPHEVADLVNARSQKPYVEPVA